MKKPKIFPIICFIICVSQLFAACAPIDKAIEFFSDDGTGHIFKIALDGDPVNLDPQIAADENSVTVAKNLFAGLMEYDENGRLVCDVAEDYEVSGDGLNYTFYIKEGFKWHALGNYEYPLTANDFVYGFQRLMDPKTASPHSEKYFCIENSEAARKGELSVKEIGVRAIDDYTLKFTLSYPNAEFLQLLAELPASPCCEDFFITSGGKYGLEAEAVCSNGPFFVRYWLHDPYGSNNYVRLRRNPGYSDVKYVNAGGINYLVTKNAPDKENDFSGGAVEAILYKPGELAKLDGEEFTAGYGDVCGLIFNEKEGIFSSAEVRQVFSWALDRDALKDSAPEIFLPAEGMIPDGKTLYLRGYARRLPEEVSVSNSAMAEYKWSFLLSEREKSSLIGMTVMVKNSFGYPDCLEAVSDGWYSVFGTHISIELVTESDFDSRIKSGDFDIALTDLSSGGDGAMGYIKPFGKDKKFGISLPEVIEAENKSGKFESLSSYVYACTEAENAVLSGYHFIPLWQLPTVCIYDDDCEGIYLDPFYKTVYFKNAKYY